MAAVPVEVAEAMVCAAGLVAAREASEAAPGEAVAMEWVAEGEASLAMEALEEDLMGVAKAAGSLVAA